MNGNHNDLTVVSAEPLKTDYPEVRDRLLSVPVFPLGMTLAQEVEINGEYAAYRAAHAIASEIAQGAGCYEENGWEYNWDLALTEVRTTIEALSAWHLSLRTALVNGDLGNKEAHS
jgi:hypothetical protein